MPDPSLMTYVLSAALAWPITGQVATQPDAPAPVTAPAPTPAPVAATAPATAAPPPASSVPPPSAMPCPPPPAPAMPKVRKGTPLIGAGLGITGVIWLTSTLMGAIAIDEARKKARNSSLPEGEETHLDRDRKRGRALMVPIAGPFMALQHTNSVTRKYGLAINGSLQIAGIIMALVGTVEQVQYRQAQRFGLAAHAGADGAHVAVDVRF